MDEDTRKAFELYDDHIVAFYAEEENLSPLNRAGSVDIGFTIPEWSER